MLDFIFKGSLSPFRFRRRLGLRPSYKIEAAVKMEGAVHFWRSFAVVWSAIK